MPNPSGPDSDDTSGAAEHDAEPTAPADDAAEPAGDAAEPVEQAQGQATVPDAEGATEVLATGDAEDTTKVLSTETLDTETEAETPPEKRPERRFTAPGFDAGETEVIQSVPEPATELMYTQQTQEEEQPTTAIPGRSRKLLTPRGQGWAMALILIVLTLLAIVVLGAVWLTRHRGPQVSQEDLVRDTIESFDAAVKNGDLATLRTITCGSFRDRYVNYSEKAWDDTYSKVAAAKQYPVVASIDEVVVNGDYAEANVTAYMAVAPDVQSPRSFDLQYRDDQWKICQSATR